MGIVCGPPPLHGKPCPFLLVLRSRARQLRTPCSPPTSPSSAGTPALVTWPASLPSLRASQLLPTYVETWDCALPTVRNASRWKTRRHKWSMVLCSVLPSHYHPDPLQVPLSSTVSAKDMVETPPTPCIFSQWSGLLLWGRIFHHCPHGATQLKDMSTGMRDPVMEKPGMPSPPQKQGPVHVQALHIQKTWQTELPQLSVLELDTPQEAEVGNGNLTRCLTPAQTHRSGITNQKDAFCRGRGTRRVPQQHKQQPGGEDFAHAAKGKNSSLPVHPPPKKGAWEPPCVLH